MISVILATKNGGRYIRKAIESVQAQTEKDLELIVVSDGSTDDTDAVVKDMAAADPRIRLISLAENVGPGKARHLGIQAATIKGKEPYIALIDDDDIWVQKEKLARQKNFLDSHHDHVLVGSARIFDINDRGEPFPDAEHSEYRVPRFDEDIRKEMLRRNCFVTSSVMFRKRAYDAIGGFKPLYLAEEYDLWLRMGKIGKIANIDGAEIRYMVRPDGLSESRKKDMYLSILKLVKENRKEYPLAILGIMKAYGRILFLNIKQAL